MTNPNLSKLGHSIHVTLTNRGGVGKSANAASLIAYMRTHFDDQVYGYDTDASNQTLMSRYKMLPVKKIDLMDGDNDAYVSPRKLDEFYSMAIETPGVHVIDNPDALFRPMLSYMGERGIPELAEEHNTPFYVHCTIANVNGRANNCVESLELMADRFSHTIKFVVWINEMQGVPEIDRVAVVDHPRFLALAERIAGVVNVNAVADGVIDRTIFPQLDKVNW